MTATTELRHTGGGPWYPGPGYTATATTSGKTPAVPNDVITSSVTGQTVQRH